MNHFAICWKKYNTCKSSILLKIRKNEEKETEDGESKV